MVEITELVRQIAAELEGECRAESDGTFVITCADDELELPEAVVYADEIEDGPAKGTALLVARAAAFELEPGVDVLEALLADEATTTWFARAYIDLDDEQPPVLVAEAALPLASLSTELAALMVAEVIELASSALTLVEDDDFENEGDDDDEDDEA